MRSVVVIVVSCLVSSLALGQNKVIYGRDGRVDVRFSKSKKFKKLAQSTAAMIETSNLKLVNNEYKMASNVRSLRSSQRLCSGERYSNQPTAASCSGFLVGDDLLVTAGHCVSGYMAHACDSFKWVFDYNINSKSNPFAIKMKKSNVYGCKEVVSVELSKTVDFAVIRLDRKVKNRRPLKFRTSGSVSVGTQLTVIGYPWGLPGKITTGGSVMYNDHSVFFGGNLDTFQGNSGSAVFNAKTGVVEGILVRGRADKYRDYDNSRGQCHRVNTCDQNGENCVEESRIDGEEVTRITHISKIIKEHL